MDVDQSDTNESGRSSRCDCGETIAKTIGENDHPARSGVSVNKFSIDTILGIKPKESKPSEVCAISGEAAETDFVDGYSRKGEHFPSAECFGMSFKH